jgi:hypothetical protein
LRTIGAIYSELKAPADTKTLAEEIVRVYAVCARRKDDEKDMRVVCDTFIDELTNGDFGGHAVLYALANWKRGNKFVPSLSEIIEIAKAETATLDKEIAKVRRVIEIKTEEKEKQLTPD